MRKSSLLLMLFVICVPAKAQQTRVQERNKEVARSFFEQVLDQGHLEKYADSHAPNFVAHGRTQDGTLEEDMAAAREERKAVPGPAPQDQRNHSGARLSPRVLDGFRH